MNNDFFWLIGPSYGAFYNSFDLNPNHNTSI